MRDRYQRMRHDRRPRRRGVPVERDEIRELSIDALGSSGEGIAHVGEYVVFVPGTLPGETVRARITSAGRKHGRGELVDVIARAPERVRAACEHFLACGGCQLQHMDYEAQLDHKRARVRGAVDRALVPGAAIVEPTVPAPEPFGQRHKIAIHLMPLPRGRLAPAFHRPRSVELEVIRECPASDPAAFALARRAVHLLERLGLGAWDPDRAPTGRLRTVLVRRSASTGESHVVVVATPGPVPELGRALEPLRAAGATTLSLNHNDGPIAQLLGRVTERVFGPDRIVERLGGLEYLISPTSFFQTGPRIAERMTDEVVGWLDPRPQDQVADLYCGGGLLTLPLARRAAHALGIEASPEALDDAAAAADRNGIENVTWLRGDVAPKLASCGRTLPVPDLVALDPPRQGMGPGVARELARLRPRRIAYVSCDPQALQRDLVELADAGFRTRRVVPFDMFPQTAHVEAVACLERR